MKKKIEYTSPKIVDFTVRKTINGATQVITVTIKIIDWYRNHLELSFSFCASILRNENNTILWLNNYDIINYHYLNISTCWASISLIWSKYCKEAVYNFFADPKTAVSSSVLTLVFSSSTSAHLKQSFTYLCQLCQHCQNCAILL